MSVIPTKMTCHRLAVLLAVITMAAATTANAAIVTKHFCWSTPSLLSGGLTSCLNVTAAGCQGGLASAYTYVREWENAGEPVSFIFPIETLSPFVQMHADHWGVNTQFLDRFNIRTTVATMNVWAGTLSVPKLRNPDRPALTTNAVMRPGNEFQSYRRTSYIDRHTGIGYIFLQSTLEGFVSDFGEWRQPVFRALEELQRDANPPQHIFVFDFGSAAMGHGNYSALLSEIQKLSPIKIDAFMSAGASNPIPAEAGVQNGTYFFAFDTFPFNRGGTAGSNLMCQNFNVDTADGNRIVSMTNTSHPLSPLPSRLQDSAYYADVAWAQGLASAAVATDPIVGYTTEMPVMLRDAYAACTGGQCEIGTAFTDAYVWKYNVDIGLQNSAGPRGNGWPAGAVRFSRMYDSMPWPNTMTCANLTGLSIWQMLNHSLGAPITTTFYLGGQRLLQVSGVKIRYNDQIGPEKILSIDVYNKRTRQWGPLERLKVYTACAPSYEAGFLEPYTTHFTKTLYRGETVGVNYPNDIMQNILAEYLTATTSPTNPKNLSAGVDRMQFVAGASSSDAMNWYQTQGSCGKDTFWDAPAATCMPCPEGEHQPKSGQTSCKEKEDNTVLIAVVVPLCAILLIAVIILAIIAARGGNGENQRDVANAPKSGRVSLMFTDIQDSTRLWSNVPMAMNKALDQHHEIIRRNIVKHKAYEVKTAGDSFMIALSSEDSAAALAMDIQNDFQSAVWPPCIGKIYQAGTLEEQDEIDDDPDEVAVESAGGEGESKSPFNGIRVRIGIHSGEPKIEFDEITKGYDYYGPPVNVAARVEAAGYGGQVAVSADFLSHISNPEQFNIREIGPTELKGVSELVVLHEMLPKTSYAETRAKDFAHRAEKKKKPTALDGAAEGSSNKNSHDPYSADATTNAIKNGGDDSGSSSSASLSTDATDPMLDEAALYNYLFFVGMFRTVKDDVAKSIRASLMTAWRVQDTPEEARKKESDQKKQTKDEALERLCKRVTLSTSKKLRRLAAEGGHDNLLDALRK